MISYSSDIHLLFELWISCDDFGDGGGIDTSFNYGGEIGCFDVVFPFTVTLSDGSEVVVNNHDEFCALMVQGTLTGFVFPITLIDYDGNEIVVNSQEELDENLEDCWIDGGVFSDDIILLLSGAASEENPFGCYAINWPINVLLDNVEAELNSLEELVNYLGQGVFPTLIYPASVTLSDTGEIVEINSYEDLFSILTDCE